MIGFWFFILIMDLLIPFVMVGFGKKFMNNPPKSINCFFGYRTNMSMKNKATWEFAHKYCGRVWIRFGLVLMLLSILFLLFVFGKDVTTVGIVGGIICGVQVVLLIASVVPTETALKRTFDQNGKRKKE